MSFDVSDLIRAQLGHAMRHRDDFGLPVNGGTGVADFRTAIVVERDATNHGMDRVSVGDGIRKPLEHHDPDAFTKDRTGRFLIKRANMSVGREDHSLLRDIAVTVFQIHADTARQS